MKRIGTALLIGFVFAIGTALILLFIVGAFNFVNCLFTFDSPDFLELVCFVLVVLFGGVFGIAIFMEDE